MSLKKLGVALAVVMALGAVMASSSFGAATTGKSQWYVAGAKLAAGASKEVTCKATGTLTLESEVLGEHTKLTATGVECIGAKITQESSGSTGMAIDSGKLKFTGVTIDEPAGCKVPTTLTTEELKTFVQMESTGTTVYDKFEPATGSTGTFVKVPITGCAIESTPKVTGTAFGKSSLLTGEESAVQTLTFSSAINTAAGGSLLLGTKAATLAGVVDNELVGNAKFGAKEE
jgi:hypothetical protein